MTVGSSSMVGSNPPYSSICSICSPSLNQWLSHQLNSGSFDNVTLLPTTARRRVMLSQLQLWMSSTRAPIQNAKINNCFNLHILIFLCLEFCRQLCTLYSSMEVAKPPWCEYSPDKRRFLHSDDDVHCTVNNLCHVCIVLHVDGLHQASTSAIYTYALLHC